MQTATIKPIKLQTIRGSEWVRHVYPNEFCLETTSTGSRRIHATASTGYVDLLLALTAALSEPFFVLYVLVVSRKGENEAARYQSSEMSQAEVRMFFEQFEDYLENDGRHHIWIHSPESSTTLVYDNHDLIYCYGSLEILSTILQNNGLKAVTEMSRVEPHGHCYNQEFDICERELLKFFEWTKSPLQPQDDPR